MRRFARRPLHAARRLSRRLLFRPHFSLLLFGSVSLLSNWLWIGSGLFLKNGFGLAIWLLSLAATVTAGLSLVRRRFQLQALVLLLAATIAVPMLALIALRWKTGVPLLMHDGAYHTEEAIKVLLSGRDPYGFDYTTSSMRLWRWYDSVPIDPSLYHFIYPPAAFLLPLPLYVMAHTLGLPFDFRLIELALEAIAVIAVLALDWRWEWKYVLLIALFLDPFFYFAQGRTDILFLAPILLAVLAWQRKHVVLAALALSVAVSFKQLAVFYVVLFAVLLVVRWRNQRWPTTRLALALGALLLPAAGLVLPFFLWNPHAYWADTVSFFSGADPHSYAIQGYGFSELLLLLRLIPNRNAYFPFGLVQLVTVGPLFVLAMVRLWQRPSIATALWWGTALLALFVFFSRFVNDNYIADLLFLAVLAGAARRGAVSTHSADTIAQVAA